MQSGLAVILDTGIINSWGMVGLSGPKGWAIPTCFGFFSRFPCAVEGTRWCNQLCRKTHMVLHWASALRSCVSSELLEKENNVTVVIREAFLEVWDTREKDCLSPSAKWTFLDSKMPAKTPIYLKAANNKKGKKFKLKRPIGMQSSRDNLVA